MTGPDHIKVLLSFALQLVAVAATALAWAIAGPLAGVAMFLGFCCGALALRTLEWIGDRLPA